MRRFGRLPFIAVLSLIALTAGAMNVLADGSSQIRAVPWTFVGSAAQCGTAGSRIVTSAWLGGMGLPDNGGPNGVTATRNDPHLGLLLNKNGPTPNCSSSGATITGVKGMTVTAGFHLGYDYRVGGHCGAGAPRFNVDTDQGFFFVGCANGVQTPAPQDGEWSRTRSDLTNCGSACSPGSITAGAKIKSIEIVFDEGTDTVSVSDPTGVGLAVLDNIDINGTLITRGSGTQPRPRG
jgi:hypothetical protein